VLCIRQCDGRVSLMAWGAMMASIGNGPAHLAANFRVPKLRGRWAVASHTFCPTEKTS
jgi:hypothetical protein